MWCSLSTFLPTPWNLESPLVGLYWIIFVFVPSKMSSNFYFISIHVEFIFKVGTIFQNMMNFFRNINIFGISNFDIVPCYITVYSILCMCTLVCCKLVYVYSALYICTLVWCKLVYVQHINWFVKSGQADWLQKWRLSDNVI